jgi:hypothetical protein
LNKETENKKKGGRKQKIEVGKEGETKERSKKEIKKNKNQNNFEYTSPRPSFPLSYKRT